MQYCYDKTVTNHLYINHENVIIKMNPCYMKFFFQLFIKFVKLKNPFI